MKEETVILCYLLLVLWIQFLWNLYLGLREYQVLETTKVRNIPTMVTNIYSVHGIEEARKRSQETIHFWIALDLVDTILDSIFFIIHLRGRIWKISRRLAHLLRLPDDEITISVIYLALFYTLEDLINIPFLVYYAIYMDCGSGPKKINYDKIFKMAFSGYTRIIVMPFLIAIWNVPRILIVQNIKTYNFVVLWLHTIILQLLVKIIVAEFAPQFALSTWKFELDKNFYNELVDLAEKSGHQMQDIHIVGLNCSRRSFNTAFTVGIFKRAIFVSGEMSQQCLGKKGLTNKEMLAVVAHELGHSYYEHEWSFMLFYAMTSFLKYMSLYMFYPQPIIYRALGFHDEQPVVVGLSAAVQFILQPYDFVISWLQNAERRKQERRADIFAANLTSIGAMQRALMKISSFNLEFPVHDEWFSSYRDDHPSLMDRLKILENRKQWKIENYG